MKLRVIGRSSSSCCASISRRRPSHEVLAAKLDEFERAARRLRRGDPLRLRQGRPRRTSREMIARRARAPASRCWSTRRATTTRATRARRSSRPTAPSCARWSGAGSDEADLDAPAQTLRADLELEALLVTRSEEGMTLFTATGESATSRHEAREVFDVSGAGDTVIATLARDAGRGRRPGGRDARRQPRRRHRGGQARHRGGAPARSLLRACRTGRMNHGLRRDRRGRLHRLESRRRR